MSQGYQAQLGIDVAQPVGKGFEFESCAITKLGAIVDTSGIRGTRSHRSERTRFGTSTIRGTLVMYPSAEDLALLLPWILGAAPVGNTFALSDLLSERYVVVDKVAKVYSYAGCKVQRATFIGQDGQPIKLVLELIGKSETESAAGTFPTVSYTNTSPFIFADSTLTLLGTPRNVREWSVAIDNQLEVSYYNSTLPTRILARDRTVTLDCVVPFDASDADLYNQAQAGSAATLVLAHGGYSLGFAFATLQFAPQGPTIAGKTEFFLPLHGVARKVATTSELVVTLDSTP